MCLKNPPYFNPTITSWYPVVYFYFQLGVTQVAKFECLFTLRPERAYLYRDQQNWLDRLILKLKKQKFNSLNKGFRSFKLPKWMVQMVAECYKTESHAAPWNNSRIVVLYHKQGHGWIFLVGLTAYIEWKRWFDYRPKIDIYRWKKPPHFNPILKCSRAKPLLVSQQCLYERESPALDVTHFLFFRKRRAGWFSSLKKAYLVMKTNPKKIHLIPIPHILLKLRNFNSSNWKTKKKTSWLN